MASASTGKEDLQISSKAGDLIPLSNLKKSGYQTSVFIVTTCLQYLISVIWKLGINNSKAKKKMERTSCRVKQTTGLFDLYHVFFFFFFNTYIIVTAIK